MVKATSGSGAGHKAPVRATQGLVAHMGYCRTYPSLWALEVAWRWAVGVPFLLAAWREAQRIMTVLPPDVAGLGRLEWTNPWLSSVLIADAVGRYQPLVVGGLRWLLPLAVIGWAALSGIGRMAILDRMVRIDGRDREQADFLDRPVQNKGASGVFAWKKLPGVIGLQALWLVALLGCWWAWYTSVGWAASRYLTVGSQPDLVPYLCWLIFLSLAIYVAWAMTSWVVVASPVIFVMEGKSLAGALGASFRLGRELSGKLAEVNLVMAIVKIALIVLAMVFAAAPLPFSDGFGPEFMHVLYALVAVWWLVANDYFHVVRLRSFVVLRGMVCEVARRSLQQIIKFASYKKLHGSFVREIFGIDRWFISDESSLWDFTEDSTLEPYFEKIRTVYGVEVADIDEALLWKIFERISKTH